MPDHVQARVGAERTALGDDFDVFVSYSTADQKAVISIVDELRRRRLRVWFDEDELRPGDPILKVLEQGLSRSRAIACFVGPAGFGQYHTAEMEVALQFQIERGRQVIPVLLPNTSDAVAKALPPFLRRSSMVQFGSTNDDSSAIARLIWGITGERPHALLKHRARPSEYRRTADADPFTDAAEKLTVALRRSIGVTFFLGAGSSPSEPNSPPRPCEITRGLLLELGLIDEKYKELLPLTDTAGTYYRVKTGVNGLEDRVTRLIADRSRCITRLHANLAKVIAQLTRLAAEKRRRATSEPQLILSTSLDLMCERAFLRAGMSFTRLVHHRSGSELTINEYKVKRLDDARIVVRSHDGQEGTVDPNDLKSLDEIIELGGEPLSGERESSVRGHVHPLRDLTLSSYKEPYLYKYHGSHDVPSSCALATDDFLRLASAPNVPHAIGKILANTAAVFLGCGLLDADVLHLHETLLRRAFASATNAAPRYAVLVPPDEDVSDDYRRMEAGIWPRVKEEILAQMGVRILEGDSARFLDVLGERITSSMGTQT